MNSDNKNENNKISDDLRMNKKDEFQKRKSSRIMTKEKLGMFDHEDEKKRNEENKGNIEYKDDNSEKKSIKFISLNLLLSKIVIDDFIEKNIFLIYYFCQQCFCFIDTEILFHKIINCYKFYRQKGVPATYLCNLITFFNVLVIEMFEYNKKRKQ